MKRAIYASIYDGAKRKLNVIREMGEWILRLKQKFEMKLAGYFKEFTFKCLDEKFRN